jgi:hypothetical protein
MPSPLILNFPSLRSGESLNFVRHIPDNHVLCKRFSFPANNVLIGTSMIIPTIFILLAYKYNIYNTYFTVITTLCSMFSVLFWWDPINNRNKLIHRLDGFTAKYVILNYAIYKIFVNRNNFYLFFFNYFFMLYYFYLSNKYSSKKWCSASHYLPHICAHIHGILCSYLTFFNFPLYTAETPRRFAPAEP